MTAVDQADLVVVGMRVGGEAGRRCVGGGGLNVTGIEAELVGWKCPYWACIPSKMMILAANLLAEARRIPGRAGTAVVQPDWATVALESGRRRPTTGTTASRLTDSSARVVGSYAARGRGAPVPDG